MGSGVVRGEDDYLSRVASFDVLDRDARDAIARISSVRRYEDRSLILLEGDLETPVFFVLEGAVRVFRSNLDGREQTLIYLHAGETLNLPGAFATRHVVPASAEAVGDVLLFGMPVAALRRVVLEHPAVGIALLGMLADRVQHLSVMVYELGLLSVRARIARFLLSERSARRDSPVRWTHAQIAARVGTVRVVVSRTLSALADEGIIRLDRQRIEIVDPVALAHMAEIDVPS